MSISKNEAMMTTETMKSLFQFIDFLYSNIDYFKQYDSVVDEIKLLEQQQKEVYTIGSRNELQNEIATKFTNIKENVIDVIIDKSVELGLYDKEKISISWCLENEVERAKKHFLDTDIPFLTHVLIRFLEFKKSVRSYEYCGFFSINLE